MATNKNFLYLNISQLYRNYAMPYMTQTYPENIRLLSPSSCEEIGFQHTDRPQEFHPASHMHIFTLFFFCSLLLHFLNILYPSLASLGLVKIFKNKRYHTCKFHKLTNCSLSPPLTISRSLSVKRITGTQPCAHHSWSINQHHFKRIQFVAMLPFSFGVILEYEYCSALY